VNTGSFLKHAALVDLPRLVRKQRKLESQIASLEQLQTQEKAVRAQIFVLLERAGIEPKDGVTCNGYDVVRRHRDGQARISGEKLVAAGVSRIDIAFATETGKPSDYAEVKPMKGAKVRKAA